MKKVLLTTPVGPYDTHYYNQSLTDVMDQRFSRGCGIFTVRGHIHINFAHVLAQNIDAPAVFLEYPYWEDFDAELAKGYDFVGINGFHNQRDIVIEMCHRTRKLAPNARIILGGWSGVAIKSIYPEWEWKKYADEICVGEGISFMRHELGEDPEGPVNVTHLPRCSMALPWIEPHPPGDMGTVVASLGCPNGCNFCGTTHMFSRKRLRILSPEQTFEEMKRYFRESERFISVNLIEEDSFADSHFIQALGKLIQEDTEFGLERLNFFCLSSNQSLSRWDFDDLLKTGVMSIFIGVESKFAPDAGYKKRTGRTIDETFRELHRRGIGTIGAWMLGFDFQNRDNVTEDLEHFISLEPTYQQLTRLCPFPGTPLWDEVAEQGRIDPKNVPVEAISFFGGGGMEPKGFYDHEIMEIVERGYVKLYETWGSSLFRQWKVVLNGFEYCSQHRDPLIRRRAEFHRRTAAEMYPLMYAQEVYAPNTTVRKRVRDELARYRALLGEPTKAQRMLEGFVLKGARKAIRREIEQPINLHPKQEPFKRYEYHRRHKPGECPYTVTHPRRELSYKLHDLKRRALAAALTPVLQAMDHGILPWRRKQVDHGKAIAARRIIF
jgi:haloalkane dehalogenase